MLIFILCSCFYSYSCSCSCCSCNMFMLHVHAARTYSIDMHMDIQHGDMDTKHGQAAWKCSSHIHHRRAAWTSRIGMQHTHAAWRHGNTAWTYMQHWPQTGHAKWTWMIVSRMDKEHGQVAWTNNMDLPYGHAWTCSIDLQHGHAAWT